MTPLAFEKAQKTDTPDSRDLLRLVLGPLPIPKQAILTESSFQKIGSQGPFWGLHARIEEDRNCRALSIVRGMGCTDVLAFVKGPSFPSTKKEQMALL